MDSITRLQGIYELYDYSTKKKDSKGKIISIGLEVY